MFSLLQVVCIKHDLASATQIDRASGSNASTYRLGLVDVVWIFTLSAVVKTIKNDHKRSKAINLSLKLQSYLLNSFDKYSYRSLVVFRFKSICCKLYKTFFYFFISLVISNL